MLRNLIDDESGVIISAELILVLTIAVLAMVVGLTEVTVAINTELNDLSNAFGRLDQSFGVTAFSGHGGQECKFKSFTNGTIWHDTVDDCDVNSTCDLVVGPPRHGGEGNTH